MENEESVRRIKWELPEADPAMRGACEDAVIDAMFAAQRVRLAIKTLMENGQEDAALVLMNDAVKQGIQPCSASDVRAWFERLKTAAKFPQIEKLTVRAIRSGVQGLTSEDIRHWIQVLFDNKKAINVGAIIAEDLKSSQIAAFSDEEVLGLIRELFASNCPTGAVGIAVLAFGKDSFSLGVREDDIRQWMDVLFQKGKYPLVPKLGTVVLNRRAQFRGIADQEVLTWIQKCKDYHQVINGANTTPDMGNAGFLQVAAFANGVQGVTVKDIGETIKETFNVDVFIEKTAYAQEIGPLLTAVMTQMKARGVSLDDLTVEMPDRWTGQEWTRIVVPLVEKLLNTGQERMVIVALTAIECGFPGVDSAKVKEWVDICLHWAPANDKMREVAAQIIAKAYEKNMAGMDRIYDLGSKDSGDAMLGYMNAAMVFGVALRNDRIRSISDEQVRARTMAGSIKGIEYLMIPAIESGRLKLKGTELISWVNILLTKGAEERGYWEKRTENFSAKDFERESFASILKETQEHLAGGLHKSAFDVLIAGLDSGSVDGIMLADILRIKKELEDLGRTDQGMEILIAAKEAGIDIPEELMRTSVARYATGPRGTAGSGDRALKLFAMYQKHSRAQRRYPELCAVLSELSDSVAEQISVSNPTHEGISRESVEQVVRKKLNWENQFKQDRSA